MVRYFKQSDCSWHLFNMFENEWTHSYKKFENDSSKMVKYYDYKFLKFFVETVIIVLLILIFAFIKRKQFIGQSGAAVICMLLL